MNPTPPLPDNELARLDALHQYQILDTPPEKAFDDLTFLAAQVCQTPIALISLVDGSRQWFKSKLGLTITETERDVAFCAYAIQQQRMLVVKNALADKRFATNPLVTKDPNIRFYAGVPLVTPEGFVIGTLCVIDTVPRDLSLEQMEALRGLGSQVMAQFEMRRNVMNMSRIITEREQAKERDARSSYFIELLYQQGVDKVQRADYREAIEDFDSFLRVNPNGVKAYYDRGLARCRLHDYRGAIKDFDSFLRFLPNNAEARRQRGFARSQVGDYLGAMADYSQATQLDPDYSVVDRPSSQPQQLPSSLPLMLNEANGSKSTQSLQINPNYDTVYDRQGDKHTAIENYTQEPQINPNQAAVYYNRGVIRYQQGDKLLAIEDYTQALQINPNHAKAYNDRGVVRYVMGDKQGAVEDFNFAVRINPNKAAFYYNRGVIRNELGDKLLALQDFNQTLEINPNQAAVYYNRGVIRYQLGDKLGAIEDYTQALQINPDHAKAYNARGVIQYQLGDKLSAIEDFQKAADIYLKQGDEDTYQASLNRINSLVNLR